MVIAVISCWGVSILFAYLLGIRLGMGLAGCWIAFMLDEMFRGSIFFIRFRSRKWTKKESDPILTNLQNPDKINLKTFSNMTFKGDGRWAVS